MSALQGFGQLRYPTSPECVSSDFRTRTLRRALDATMQATIQAVARPDRSA